MNNKSAFAQINYLLSEEKASEAKAEFDKLEKDSSVEYLLTEGKIEQKFQNWSKAINAYNQVLLIDPDNQEAENNLHLIKNILNFWNPEMFNP